MSETRLTHLDDSGAARMVDVGAKAESHREATAECFVRMAPDTVRAVREATLAKDVAKKSAERAFSSSVPSHTILEQRVCARRLMRRCPDDVETASQSNVSDDVFIPLCQLPKHTKPADPESRRLPVFTQTNLIGWINAWQSGLTHDASTNSARSSPVTEASIVPRAGSDCDRRT